MAPAILAALHVGSRESPGEPQVPCWPSPLPWAPQSCHGHPGAPVGTHLSTAKQEASGKSGLLCGTPAPPFKRDLGASHRSLLSQHLRGWVAPQQGQPGCRQPSSRAARDGAVQSVCSFPVFHSCGLEKCVHELSCCGIMSWAFGWALFSPGDELNSSTGLCCAGLAGNLLFPTCFFFRGGRSKPTCPCPLVGERSSFALCLIHSQSE